MLGLALACSSGDDDDNDTSGTPTGSSTGTATGTGTGTTTGNQGTGGRASTGGRESTGGKQATGGRKATGGSQADDDDDDSSVPPTTEVREPCESLEGLDSDCLAQASYAKPRPVNIVIVLDKSGSMGDDASYGQPKWQAVTSALAAALDKAKTMDNISFGLELFPQQDVSSEDCTNEECCAMADAIDSIDVELQPAAFAVDEINDVLDETTPGGNTPTAQALDLAYAYLTSGNGAAALGDKYVLLATDGGPNCNDALDCPADECTYNLDGRCDEGNCCDSGDASHLWCVDHQATADRIAELADKGIKTFVVGIPGSDPYAVWLDEFAEAGQAPAEDADHSYYAVQASGGVDALTEVFEKLTVDLVKSCRIKFTEKPPSWSTNLVNVAIDCTLVPRGGDTIEVEGSAGASGAGGAATQTLPRNWIIDDSTDPPTVEILGSYCEQIEKGVERVDVIVGCQQAL